ncbi:MAG: hypothetical protein LBV09_07355 [Deferribacteraceae bacterium]|nr:hypothetical protein [Deferribacteraceae bacterium]
MKQSVRLTLILMVTGLVASILGFAVGGVILKVATGFLLATPPIVALVTAVVYIYNKNSRMALLSAILFVVIASSAFVHLFTA